MRSVEVLGYLGVVDDLPADHTAHLLSAWNDDRPDFDLGPAHVLARMRRLMSLIEPVLEQTLAQFDLNHASFDTLSALRRIGHPYRMTATELARQCLRAQATLTSRIARLEREGLVTRATDPRDRRSVIVSLTELGLERIDAAAATYLETEHVLMSGLAPEEQADLADRLHHLLLSFEGYDVDWGDDHRVALIEPLGVWVESVHHSMQRRHSVGLDDRPGLLIAKMVAAGAAQALGLSGGDLLLSVGGTPARSAALINHRLSQLGSSDVSVPIEYARHGSPDRVVELHHRPDER